ncbi:peptidase S41, partial [bacterium]|nr:peptidase S41 [candidate division CSSED10-310 bacterium]
AWQYKGPAGCTGTKIYQSVRLNRKTEVVTEGLGFGGISHYIDAKALRGKEVKLSAYVRAGVSGTGNQGQLWLRVDRENKQMGFFDNMQDRPITASEWQVYTIEGPVADDSLRLNYGAFLAGCGKTWIDDWQLYSRESGGEWKAIAIPNPGFEDGGDPWITAWSKSCPGYGCRDVADNPHHGDRCMLIESVTEYRTEPLFDASPKAGEAIIYDTGMGFSFQIPLTVYAGDLETPGFTDKSSLDALLAALQTVDPSKMNGTSSDLRLADVIILWNVIQHFYPYRDLTCPDWESELSHFLHMTIADTSDMELSITLRKMIARIQDGQGAVYSMMDYKQAGLPFRVDWIEGRVIITAVAETIPVLAGDEIISLDGIPAEQVLVNEEAMISGSPKWKRVKALEKFGSGNEGTAVKLCLKRGDTILETDVARQSDAMISESVKPSLDMLNGNIFYVDLTRVGMAEIERCISEIAKAKGVIFDIRGTPKGNHDILSYLLVNPDTSTDWMRVIQYIYPDQRDIVGYSGEGWGLQPKQPHITGKVIFLADAHAIGYAESILGFVEHYRLGRIAGEPTAGTNGRVCRVLLPSGHMVIFTGMEVVKHDGSRLHLVGFQPDIPVERTAKGILEGRDEVLQKALAILSFSNGSD